MLRLSHFSFKREAKWLMVWALILPLVGILLGLVIPLIGRWLGSR
jgi:hypothetical protein